MASFPVLAGSTILFCSYHCSGQCVWRFNWSWSPDWSFGVSYSGHASPCHETTEKVQRRGFSLYRWRHGRGHVRRKVVMTFFSEDLIVF